MNQGEADLVNCLTSLVGNGLTLGNRPHGIQGGSRVVFRLDEAETRYSGAWIDPADVGAAFQQGPAIVNVSARGWVPSSFGGGDLGVYDLEGNWRSAGDVILHEFFHLCGVGKEETWIDEQISKVY